MPKQKLQLVLENDVIQGFSYSFSRALLEKLKELITDNKIFEDGWEYALEKANSDINSSLTEIATGTIEYIENQTNHSQIGSCATPQSIIHFIVYVEEFLAIFETKKKGK